MASDLLCLLFTLQRDEDESGVSGTGVVADGVRWPDGSAVMRWRTEYASTAVYASMEDLRCIHGHGGRTRVVWADGLDDTKCAFLRGAFGCALDANENAPFGSTGGKARRRDMRAPEYIEPEDRSEYLAGYADQAHAMWGPGWRDVRFSWAVAMEVTHGE